MIAKFDSYRKFETPLLYVCNPGCVLRNGMLTNTSGILVDTSDIEIIPTFNAPSTLNFRCYKVQREDAEENAHMMRLYRSLRNRRLIYADSIGFFVITGCTDGYEDKVAYKDITAESCEVELRTKNLPYIEDGTYKFITGEAGNPGIIEKLMLSMPLWKLGNVDVTVANRYRTFEDVDYKKNILAFMLDEIQDAYECIIIFDILNRIVNIYDRGNYVHETDIHITKDDFINSLNVTESSEDLYTALRVEGDANLNINAINPLGTGVIYNFDYYLDWMTEPLGEKVRVWQDLVKSYEESYYNLQLGRYANLTSLSNLNAERNKLNTQLTMYTRCRENIVASASDADIAAYNAVIVNLGGIPIPTDEKYLWVMYADDNIGTGITATPYGKDYIGLAYDKTTQIASNKPEDYSWFTFRNGETFPRTVDGKTKYTWIVFADSIISGMSDNPNNKAYIGVALDKDSATKSTNYGDYSWSLIENGGIGLNETLATILSLIEGVEAEIAEVDTQISALNEVISEQDTQVSTIHNAVAMDQYFTTEELDELNNYIVEGSYTDEYVTVTENMTYAERFAQMKILYDRAADQLVRVAFPTQEFSMDVENFIFIKEFERWSDQLETGCLINAEVDDNDVAALFLTSFTVNYEDKSLSMTFGNRYNRFDPKALFDKVLGGISKTANTLSYITDTIYPIKNGEFNEMKEALETSRTLTKNDVLSSNNEQVIIDDTGYTGRRKLQDGTVDPKQIKINGRNIVFTDDAWETCKTAIGEIILSGGASAYGVNAEVLLGNIIMGNELHIINAEGEDMFQVTEDNVMVKVGQDYAKKEDTIAGVDVMYCRASSSSKCDETTITVDWNTTAPAWVNGQYIWQKTVTTYDDGSTTESDPTCLTGTAGESAYTVMLTNNNYTFAASEDAALVADVDCNVIAYKGSTRAIASIGSITGAPVGMSVTVSGSGTTDPKFNVAVNGAMKTKNGTLNVPVTVDSKTFNLTFAYSLAIKGEDGKDASSYSLIVSHAAIGKAEDGTYNPTAITLTGKSQTGDGALSDYAGRFIIETTTNNASWSVAYTSESNEEVTVFTVPEDIIAIRCSLFLAGGTTTLLDQQVIPVVSDGATGHDGEDGYTVILTNENHTFAGGVSAALASNVDCGVIAYKGATQVAAQIGTITGAPAGMSITISNNETTTAKFNVAVTTAMKTKSGTLNVPVTVDGKTFNMTFSYSLALSGSDAYSYTLIVSNAAVVLTSDGTYSPANITLTSKANRGVSSISTYLGRFKIETTQDNVKWTSVYTSDENESTTTYAIPSTITAIRCSLYQSGGVTKLLDQQIIPIVSDGATGKDAYTVILTNENHTFAGGTRAAIASSVDCNVIAYKGATQIAAKIGTITGMPTGMSTTISDNDSTTAKFTVAVTAEMNTQNGTLSVPVEVDGKMFNMVFTYSLALDGVGVGSTSIMYATSADGSTPPTAEEDWSGTFPSSIAEDQYLWTRTIITYTDSSISTSYSVSHNGKNGSNGLSTAIVYLYKRANYLPEIDWTTDVIYDFTNKSVRQDTIPNGWFTRIPAPSEQAGSSVFVTAATASSAGATDTIQYTEFASPVILTKNGDDAVNAATIFLYQRAADPTKVKVPQLSMTYFFSTGTLVAPSGALGKWQQSIPDNDGNPCYITQATALDTEFMTDIKGKTVDEGGGWSTPVVLVTNGEDGEPGVGVDTIIEEYYLSTSEEEPTGGTWSDTPPLWVSGKYIWTRSHIYYDDSTESTTDPVVDVTYNYLGATLDNCVTDININKTGIEQNTRYYQELYGQVARINAYIQTGVVNIDDSGKTSFGVKIGENLSVINAYIVSGSTELSSGWLSDADGGQALTPMEAIIYRVMSTGTYYGKTYRWNGTSYEEATSEGTLSSVFTSSELGFYDTGEKTAYFSNKNLNVRTVRTNKILLSNDVISDTSSSNWQIGIDNGFYLKWIGS